MSNAGSLAISARAFMSPIIMVTFGLVVVGPAHYDSPQANGYTRLYKIRSGNASHGYVVVAAIDHARVVVTTRSPVSTSAATDHTQNQTKPPPIHYSPARLCI